MIYATDPRAEDRVRVRITSVSRDFRKARGERYFYGRISSVGKVRGTDCARVEFDDGFSEFFSRRISGRYTIVGAKDDGWSSLEIIPRRHLDPIDRRSTPRKV